MAFLKVLVDPRFTPMIRIVQLILIVLVFILTIVRIALKDMPITRPAIMGIPISIKSLAIMAYEYLTEHNERFKKWGSLKAYTILNFIEILFWSVLMGLTFQTNARICIGSSCAIAWVTGIICLVLMSIAIQVFVVSFLDYRHYKKYQVRRGGKGLGPSSYETQQFSPSPSHPSYR